MIAVIAGKGLLPIKACEQLLTQNKQFFIIALFSETAELFYQRFGPQIFVVTQSYYKLGQFKALLRAYKTEHVLFIGKVDKKELFDAIKLDWQAVKLLASLINKSDAAIMERCIAELKNDAIDVITQDSVLKNLLVDPGVLSGIITQDLRKDIDLGMHIAQQISLLGIGQTVIMKDGVVLAIEALEGTDACIKRGIVLGKRGVIICKTAHQAHNKQYDIPTLGSASLAQLEKGAVAAIAWQASQMFIADYQAFVACARELDIVLVAL